MCLSQWLWSWPVLNRPEPCLSETETRLSKNVVESETRPRRSNRPGHTAPSHFWTGWWQLFENTDMRSGLLSDRQCCETRLASYSLYFQVTPLKLNGAAFALTLYWKLSSFNCIFNVSLFHYACFLFWMFLLLSFIPIWCTVEHFPNLLWKSSCAHANNNKVKQLHILTTDASLLLLGFKYADHFCCEGTMSFSKWKQRRFSVAICNAQYYLPCILVSTWVWYTNTPDSCMNIHLYMHTCPKTEAGEPLEVATHRSLVNRLWLRQTTG